MAPMIVEDEAMMAQYGVVRVALPSTFDSARWATELSQLTPAIMALEGDGEYAFYRNIMEEHDFPFDQILDSAIGSCIRRHFGITSPKTELRLDDAFCVHYNMDQSDTTGAKHMDPSDITVNMCLEKSVDARGSHVLFHGAQRLVGGTESGIESFLVTQKAGTATVHWGHHPHETTALEAGVRTNIILTYCYTDTSRSDVAKRSCYF